MLRHSHEEEMIMNDYFLYTDTALTLLSLLSVSNGNDL
jgi:hypothetical protein